MKRLIYGLLALFLSSAVILAFSEFFVFSYMVKSTKPVPCVSGKFIRYESCQKGTYIINNEIAAEYQINNQGWNSRHKEYSEDKPEGTVRIAVIGDSFVEAFQVDYDRSLAEQLEDMLGEGYEVYRFGVSGANMFHYFYMLNFEAAKFKPDIVILLLSHNDFMGMLDTDMKKPFFSTLDVSGEDVKEIPPFFKPSLANRVYRTLMTTKTFRYLLYEKHLYSSFARMVFRKQRYNAVYQANIDVSLTNNHWEEITKATRYTFNRFKVFCNERDISLFIMMDGDRKLVYSGEDSTQYYENGALALNRLANDISNESDVSFVDLHPVFEHFYILDSQRFDFETDSHYNERGHFIAALIAYGYVTGQI